MSALRPTYTQQNTINSLLATRSAQNVKLVVGVRGTGKSYLLQCLQQQLIALGTAPEAIALASVEHHYKNTPFDTSFLHDFVLNHVSKNNGPSHLLLDEITYINNWSQILHNLSTQYPITFYLTSSSLGAIPTEFSSLFPNAEIYRQLPLSFQEYLFITHTPTGTHLNNPFKQYLQCGALPMVAAFSHNETLARELTAGIYNTILVQDIMRLNSIKDVPMLERVLQYLVHNIGRLGSPKSISDHFAQLGYKIASETISNYLAALRDACIFYELPRYDLRSRRMLKNRSKYYIADTGIRHAITTCGDDIGFELENTVYLELLRRGYHIVIGKIGTGEIDFVATLGDVTEYYQVTRTIAQRSIFYEREFAPLAKLQAPGARKVILSLDTIQPPAEDGIQYVNIFNFLNETSWPSTP